MNNVPPKTKLALFSAAILLLAWIGLALWQQLTFHVVTTSPSTSSVSTIAPYFKITFNQSVVQSSLQLHITPDGFTGTPSVKDNVVTIPLNTPLDSSKTYTITIATVRSTKGKILTNRTFTFKPTYIASSDLPADQRQAVLQQENIGGTANTKDPILGVLPYQTTDFMLDQDTTPQKNPPKDLALIATLILSRSEMANEGAAVAQHKQEVLSYITSLGLDPSAYTITYVVQTP